MKRKTTKPPSIFDGDDAQARITAILHDGRVLRDLPGEVAGDLARTDHLVVLDTNETLFREDDVGDEALPIEKAPAVVKRFLLALQQ